MGDSAKQLIANLRRPERSVQVCMRADLTALMQQLERDLQVADAKQRAANSLGGGGDAREIAEQIEALRAEMLDHTVTFTLRAVPHRRWTALLAAHPPREGNKSDEAMGINEETFFETVIPECTVAPELDAEDWAALSGEDGLADVQWQQLANAAWGVNARDEDVPFSPTASRIMQGSEP